METIFCFSPGFRGVSEKISSWYSQHNKYHLKLSNNKTKLTDRCWFPFCVKMSIFSNKIRLSVKYLHGKVTFNWLLFLFFSSITTQKSVSYNEVILLELSYDRKKIDRNRFCIDIEFRMDCKVFHYHQIRNANGYEKFAFEVRFLPF